MGLTRESDSGWRSLLEYKIFVSVSLPSAADEHDVLMSSEALRVQLSITSRNVPVERVLFSKPHVSNVARLCRCTQALQSFSLNYQQFL